MSGQTLRIHDEVVEEFQYACRHCKKTAEQHTDGTEEAAGSCLFDSTTWDPMSESEWVEWRKNLWDELGGIGTEFIRDQLKQAGFARSMARDLQVYGTATIEVATDAAEVKVMLIDPARSVTMVGEGPQQWGSSSFCFVVHIYPAI